MNIRITTDELYYSVGIRTEDDLIEYMKNKARAAGFIAGNNRRLVFRRWEDFARGTTILEVEGAAYTPKYYTGGI